MNKRRIIFQIAMVIGLCLLLETISYFILRSRNQSAGFLLDLIQNDFMHSVKGFGFDEIDPLCGWAMSNKAVEAKGFSTEQNCQVLISKADFPKVPVKIFITGGSTSDLALHADNWPSELQKLL